MYDERELKWFDRMGVSRPAHLPHAISDTQENPLSEQLPSVKCSNWRIEGNELVADTDQGSLRQRIDPGYICLGTDEKNLPILKKIVL